MKPIIELICIGTELLSGRINTHTALVGHKLNGMGLELSRELTVGDDPIHMAKVFSESWKRADIIISAGGLGPTFDDLTRNIWSKVTRRPLLPHENLIRAIEKKFIARGISMPVENTRQADVLKGAAVISNRFGTAPGQYLKCGRTHLFLLPGPTNELAPMWDGFVMPRLGKIFPNRFTIEKSFHLLGHSESLINHRLEPIVNSFHTILGCSVTHGILASQSIITVKFRVDGRSQARVKKAATILTRKIKDTFGPIFFGEDEINLPEAVAALFTQKHLTLATAESCTGGLLAKLITDVSGASQFFKEGFVTYANTSKTRHLGVRPRTLLQYGAVSNQVALEMARGLRRKAGVDYALSITGIAGPTGGTPTKPVGLVFIGLSGPKRSYTQRLAFGGDRAFIRQRAALMALEMLRKDILGLV